MSQNSSNLTAMDVLTSSGMHKARSLHPECTPEVVKNAEETAKRVNALLSSLNLSAQISSGFRTSTANKNTGGAKRSAHMQGMAVDLIDPKREIANAIMRNTSVLEQFDLYMEDINHTPTWVHLQTRPTRSGNRIFKP